MAKAQMGDTNHSSMYQIFRSDLVINHIVALFSGVTFRKQN